MADHLDAFVQGAPGILQDSVDHLAQDHSPDHDARVDITDIYAFQMPGHKHKSILILNVNPIAPVLAKTFRHDAIYRLNIGADGDGKPERMFDITFSEVDEDGEQTAAVRLRRPGRDEGEGEGEEMIEDAPVSFGTTPHVTSRGELKFFAGIRSDPFFFDLVAFLTGAIVRTPGQDFFANLNVFGIALEVHNKALGPNPKIGVWGQTLVPDGSGGFMTADQMGRPAINTVFNHGQDKNTFNMTPPDQQPGLFHDKFVDVLMHAPFNRSFGDATGLVNVLLPDVLTYDFNDSAGFLNGRNLRDNVIDAELQLLTGSKTISQHLMPHSDLLDKFPFLGDPHV